MKQKVWNNKISVKERWIMMIAGIIMTITFSLLYYKNFYNKENIDKYFLLSACVVFIALGVEFIILIFNLKNNIIRSILFIILGALLVETLNNDLLLIGSILFFIIILFFMVTMLVKNIFSTVITLSISSIPFVLIVTALIDKYNAKAYLIVYIGIVIFLLFYRLCGIKINQIFIGKFMGFSNEADMYDEVQLKAQLNFIYVIVFVILNVNNMFNGEISAYGNLLNNSFLTCLAIIQINWKKIFWFLEHKK